LRSENPAAFTASLFFRHAFQNCTVGAAVEATRCLAQEEEREACQETVLSKESIGPSLHPSRNLQLLLLSPQ